MLSFGRTSADDWPAHMHDNARTGASSDELTLPLAQDWVFTPRHPPRPAWPLPARNDFWHKLHGLQARTTFDRAFHVAAAGDSLFFGSSADCKLYCLDAHSGRLRWSFFTEGPVRFAPTLAQGRVYAGADDGYVYCLAAGDGSLLWKCRPAPAERRIPSNGRMVSTWPIRTGIAVDDGRVFCCAGIFPLQGVYLCSLDSADGTGVWKRKIDGVSPQGYLLLSPSRIYLPTGRTTPAVFERQTGKRLGGFGGSGGAWALLTDDALLYGPGNKGELTASDPATSEALATFDGLHMIIKGGMSYLHTTTQLYALDRTRYLKLTKEQKALSARQDAVQKRIKQLGAGAAGAEGVKLVAELASVKNTLNKLSKAMQECCVWRRECACRCSLILVGDVLFAGGEGRVAAFSASDGEQVWSAPVSGNAYGLAASGGRLFVSTDSGSIHCFCAR